MIITSENELHLFAIKKIQKEIEAELKKWNLEETLWLRYTTVREAWAKMLHKGYDDIELYNLKIKLEREYYEGTRSL